MFHIGRVVREYQGELKERKSQSSLVASVPRELYAANTSDEDFGAYAANRVRYIGPTKVNMQVTIGCSRYLTDFAKALTPSLHSFEFPDFVYANTTYDKLLLFLLSPRAQWRKSGTRQSASRCHNHDPPQRITFIRAR